MGNYAHRTTVSVERSVAEIRRVLEKHACSGFMYGEQNGRAGIAFVARGSTVRIGIPLPNIQDAEFSKTATGRKRGAGQAKLLYDGEVRRRWRVLTIAVKAKLELVSAGISSIEREFLADVVGPDNVTVGERLLPQLESFRRTGQIPRLLPGSTER